jgi:hypothetical protein
VTFVVMAVLAGAFAISVPGRRLRRLGRLAPRAERVLDDLARAPRAETLQDVRRRLRPGEPLEALVAGVAAAASPAEARLAVNECLNDLDAALSGGIAATVAAVRLSLMAGALAAVVEGIRGLEGRTSAVPMALLAVSIGLSAAAATWELGRRADLRARHIRSEYDRVVRLLERWL